MESKELYKFTVFEDKEVFVEETKIDEVSNEEITIKKKVIEKSPTVIVLKKPTRRQAEEADLEYSVEMSKCIKKGILTKAMLAKKYSDTGGLMSETESQRLGDLYKEIFDLQLDSSKLEAVIEKTDEIKTRQEEILTKITDSRNEIVNIESGYRALFDHTADSKAQNKVLTWYILNLSYIKRELDSDAKPLYKGKDFEEKMTDYYDQEEKNTELYKSISKKITTLIAFWFFNQASTEEDFKDLDRKIENGEL